MPDYAQSPEMTGSTVPAQKVGLWEDFVDIFYAPSSVFARREHATAFVPILIVTLLIGVISIFSLDAITAMMDAEMRRAMAADPRTAQLTPDQLAAMRQFQ